LLGLRLGVGFVFFVILGVQLGAEFEKSMEIFNGAAVESLGLGLEAEEGRHHVGLAVVAIEAEGEAVRVVLAGSDDAAGREILVAEVFGIGGALGEAVGENSGFELVEPEH
jgi:hypothetical protein